MADIIYQRSLAEKNDPKDPWATEGALAPSDPPNFDPEEEQRLRPRRRSVRRGGGVQASVGAAWDEADPNSVRVATSSAIAYRNPKVFVGHEGKSGAARRIGGNGRGPHRPPSPHLARGRPPPSFAVGEGEEEVPRSKKEAARRAHVAQRCDDLERLMLRKILSKQPLHRFDHALHECNVCTKPARNGSNKLVKPKGKYAYQKLQHKHSQWPHPETVLRENKGGGEGGAEEDGTEGLRAVNVRNSKELKPENCPKLRRASTYRTIDDMAGAGRLNGLKGSAGRYAGERPRDRGAFHQESMVLPPQRGAGTAKLRTMITRYFSYWDADESGELSMKELGELLLRFVNVEREMVPDEVLRGLLRRYDVNGDGTVTFDEIAERLLLVADAPDGKPLPVPDPALHRHHVTPEEVEERAKAAALERAADRLEKQWVLRLATKVAVHTPSMLAKSLRASLEWYDLDGSGQLDVEELRKVLTDAMPAASRKEIECLVKRYDNQDCGVVSIGRAVARMMPIVEEHACGGDLGNGCTNNAPPDAPQGGLGGGQRQKKLREQQRAGATSSAGGVKTPGQLKRMQMLRMETALVKRLRSRMTSDSHLALRRTLKRLMHTFDGGGAYGADGNKDDEEEELKYHEIIKALRLFFPAEEDSVLRDFVRHLDADRSGSISLEELSNRMIAGMKRLEGGQGTTLTIGARARGATVSKKGQGNDDHDGAEEEEEEEEEENFPQNGGAKKTKAFDDVASLGDDSFAEDIMDDALFDAPKEESDFKRAKRAAALEMALLTKLERRIKSGSASEGRGGLAHMARRYISHFAQSLHKGKLKTQHEDGSFDIELPDPEGGLLSAVSSSCIVPVGKWEGYGAGRTWEGETEPLKEGMELQFRNGAVLNHDEFREAIKTTLPSATKAEIEMVLRLFDEDMNGFVTVEEFAARMLQIQKERDEGRTPAAAAAAISGRTRGAKTSAYLSKKREQAREKKRGSGPVRHVRTNFEY
jgi:Ca2+-binding EF-hand superfamily protein